MHIFGRPLSQLNALLPTGIGATNDDAGLPGLARRPSRTSSTASNPRVLAGETHPEPSTIVDLQCSGSSRSSLARRPLYAFSAPAISAASEARIGSLRPVQVRGTNAMIAMPTIVTAPPMRSHRSGF